MGMIFTETALGMMPLELKPPDVVSQIDPGGKLGLGQFGEIAIDRRPVIALVGQRIGHLSMGQWASRLQQLAQHRHPGPGTPQARPANAVFDSLGGRGFGWHQQMVPGDDNFYERSLHDRDGREQLNDRRHEGRQVGRLAAGHKMPVDHYRRILPDRPGVHQVVLDAGAARHPHPAVDAC